MTADASAVTLVTGLAQRAKTASRALVSLRGSVRDAALRRMAEEVRSRQADILAANAADVDAAESSGLARPLIERLKLDGKRIEKIARAIEEIAAQTDPVGQTLEGYVRPNGLRIEKRRVPLGVVLFFYESRPNVTTDAAALCLKSANAVILRGGKESLHSNRALVSAVRAALEAADVPPDAVVFLDNPDRSLVPPLLKLNDLIDVVIPRGGHSLITTVVRESTIPVLKHFDGNCHVYVDASAIDIPDDVVRVCVNAKTSYPGGAVCNAAEKILFHAAAAPELLPKVAAALRQAGVDIRGDEESRRIDPSITVAATEEDWPKEYLSLTIAFKVVPSLRAAIDHINRYGSRHTDAILTTDLRAAETFVNEVDSASVMVNASTRFADGGEYGLGAELGISTDKLHARGPMGAAELTTYKWIVSGHGHCR
ncbi:MAG: glutamate-5-semialdehyde dehydrogenase [Tepidisphaerales bacterium]